MGFEFEDARQAVQHGKLSVEEAIEWIVQGKPSAAGSSGAPVLRLNRNATPSSELGSLGSVGSNPFSNPQPISAPSPSPAASTSPPAPSATESSGSHDGSGVRIPSRHNHSDEQRQYKQKFEEKQREEMRKKIKQ